MTAIDFLRKHESAFSVTFIIARAVKDEHSPSYSYQYQTTSIRAAWEWLESPGWLEDYIVLNADHPPICIPGFWQYDYKAGRLKCCIIVKPEDLRKTCGGEKQFRDMLDWYERTVK